MDSVAVAVVVFCVSPAGNSVGVGDKEPAKGGLTVVREVMPGKDSRLRSHRYWYGPAFFRRGAEGLVIVVRGFGKLEELAK